MTKRRPFASHDPNVQRTSDDTASVTSSVPSVEEVLRLRRRRKKLKTTTTIQEGGFLINSTSKTPRISNRTKQLPPRRRATTKQLRRLEQSMASRASSKQDEQQRASFSDISTNTTRQDVNVTKRTKSTTVGGTKRKERSDDDASKSKKPRQPSRDEKLVENATTTDKTIVKKTLETLASGGVQSSPNVRKESPVDANRNNHVQDPTRKQSSRNGVAAESLDKDRGDSNNKSKQAKLSTKDDIVESPTAMMDCSSDEGSLNLSPDTDIETDRYPRLSMTTHGVGVDPLTSPNLGSESTGDLPKTMQDLLQREDDGAPIVTKGMLSRARESKADNEQVIDAMMNSGPPYIGRARDERSPTPDASMVGTMIGINLHEGSDSLDGSEVTMLTTDSSLNDLIENGVTDERTNRQHNAHLDDKSQGSRRANDKKQESSKTSPDDVSAVPDEASASRASKKRRHRSSAEKELSSIPEPEEEPVDTSNQAIRVEHNGGTLEHPPLPSGWVIRVSNSKQRLFYNHPDHGSTWHCPIVLSQSVFDSISKFFSIPTAVINAPTAEKENEKETTLDHDDDDTESEDSEVWIRDYPRDNDGTRAKEVTNDHASHASSRASSKAVDKGDEKQLDSRTEDEHAKPHSSPVVNEHLAASDQQQKDSSVQSSSPELSPNRLNFKALEERGSNPLSSKSSASDGSCTRLQQIARVSLVETEASTEELSAEIVEELVSTAHFRPSDGGAGAVATREIQTSHGDAKELIQTDVSPAKSTESTKKDRVEKNDAFLASILDSHTAETGSLVLISKSKETSSVDSQAAKEAESVSQERVSDNTNVLDDDALEKGVADPMEDELMKEDVQTVHSKDRHERSKDRLILSPTDEFETEQTVKHGTNRHDGSVGQLDSGVAAPEDTRQDFEAEVDDVVFGADHDIDLSPQAKRLSPIKHIHSFDNEEPPLPANESDDETVLEQPDDVDTSPLPPPPTNDSPMALPDDSFENESEPLVTDPGALADKEKDIMDTPADLSPSNKSTSALDDSGLEAKEEHEMSHNEQQDGDLSVESPFTETATSKKVPLAKKWKGYSFRILHPPHPLCKLITIDALLKAARRREERRKKAKKKKAHKSKSTQSKSSRRERRKTSTKLVFE